VLRTIIRNLTWRLPIIAAVALAASVVVAFAYAANRDSASAGRDRVVHRRHISPLLKRDFHVLDKRPTAADTAMDTTASSAAADMVQNMGLSTPENNRLGLAPQDVQDIPASATNPEIWLVPGSAGACIVLAESSNDADAMCGPASRVAAHGLTMLMPAGDGQQMLVGVVPNDAQSVVATPASGKVEVVPVSDNAFALPAGTLTSAYARSATGVQHQLGIPSSIR
jgi:hypothetical protein